MANEVKLGIDVDTRTVQTATGNLNKMNASLNRTQKELGQTGAAGAAADKGMLAASQGATTLGRATAGATASVGRLNAALGATSGLVRGVMGAFAAFAGVGIIRSLQETTGQLQKVNLTFQAVTGSAAAAEAEMAYVTKTADALGQSVETSAGAYAKMLAASQASNISLQDTRNLYEGLTAASTAFGLSQYELEGALNAVQQMMSKGSVQAEELRGQLGERLPGAYAIAASSMGMSTQELSKALELGKVSADDFVRAFGPGTAAPVRIDRAGRADVWQGDQRTRQRDVRAEKDRDRQRLPERL